MMNFDLREPCKNCPFRIDQRFYLRAERVVEIADALRSGGTFGCHATTVFDPETERMTEGRRTQMCGGAMVTMELGSAGPNQMMRIAERTGGLKVEKLNLDSPVAAGLDAWIRFMNPPAVVTLSDGTKVELEHCGISGRSCEDPAGYGGFGTAYRNPEAPTCHPESDCCAYCGEVCCDGCAVYEDDERICYRCAGDDE